jgi:hypothetical protein
MAGYLTLASSVFGMSFPGMPILWLLCAIAFRLTADWLAQL